MFISSELCQSSSSLCCFLQFLLSIKVYNNNNNNNNKGIEHSANQKDRTANELQAAVNNSWRRTNKQPLLATPCPEWCHRRRFQRSRPRCDLGLWTVNEETHQQGYHCMQLILSTSENYATHSRWKGRVQFIIIGRLDYCNAILVGLPKSNIMQNTAARSIRALCSRDHVTSIYFILFVH